MQLRCALGLCLLVFLGAGQARAAKSSLVGSGPIDRPTAWIGRWCPLVSPNGLGFTPTGGPVTIQFITQHRDIGVQGHYTALIDNVSVVTRAVYEANKGPAEDCGACPGTTLRFDLMDPSSLIFFDDFADGPDPRWHVGPGVFWETKGCKEDLSVICAASPLPVGSLGLGEGPGSNNYATTWLTLDGLTPGVEHVLNFWLAAGGSKPTWVRIWPGDGVDSLCDFDEFSPDDFGAGDGFGSSVAVDGDIAVVGAPGWSDGTWQSGTAYVFRREGALWLQETRLPVPPGTNIPASFGRSVSIDGTRIAVGAPDFQTLGSGQRGAVFVYEWSTTFQEWQLEQGLVFPSTLAGDQVGYSVALKNDLLVVGAPNGGASDQGAIYVCNYDGNNWIFDSTFTPSSALTGDRFGQSVATDGANRIVVGAPLADPQGTNSGRAYLLRDFGFTWGLQAELVPTTRELGAQFGYAVAIDGTRTAVGAPRQNGNSGRVEMFATSNGAALAQILDAPAGAESEFFGVGVALDDDRIAIGAWGDHNASGQSTGRTHVYQHDQSDWEFLRSYAPADAGLNTQYGAAVAMEGEMLLIGAPGDDDAGVDSGVAHQHAFLAPNCDQLNEIDACDLWNQLDSDFDRNGIPDACAPVFLSWELESPQSPAPFDGDDFGSDVALNGLDLIVGSDPEIGRGAANLYRLDPASGWITSPLVPVGGIIAGDGYGASVDVLGDLAVVGSPKNSPNGAAHVFRRSGGVWTAQAPLLPPAGVGNFGYSVAIAPDWLMISGIDNTTGSPFQNVAVLYAIDGSSISYASTLTPSALTAAGNPGYVLATDGEYFALGAPLHNSGTGEVHVYRDARSSLLYLGSVQATDPTTFDWFGSGVDIGHGFLIAGAPGANTQSGLIYGAAYVYPIDGATIGAGTKFLTQAFPPYDGAMGSSVALAPAAMGIGSPLQWERTPRCGSAELFQFNGSNWIPGGLYWSLDGEVDERLGSSMDLSRELMVLGGPRWSGGPGVVRVFGRGVDCNQNGYPDALDILSGFSSDQDANDIPDECEATATPPAFGALLRDVALAPNPFNPRVVLSFDLARDVSRGSLVVYDLAGRRVRELSRGRFAAGTHRVIWDGSDGRSAQVASGNYLIVLDMDGARQVVKAVLVR